MIRKCFNLNEKGFTLIEIGLVVGIVAIILVMAMPDMMHAREESAKNSCLVNLQNIMKAKTLWAIENNKGSEALVNIYYLVPRYLEERPVCPSNGQYSIILNGSETVGYETMCTVHSLLSGSHNNPNP